MNATAEAIREIESHADTIRRGEHERVRPGMPFTFSAAASVGDGVWQGDLGISIVAKVPEGYTRVEKPTKADRQLVPGNTEGAKHCLDSLQGVTLWRPAEWENGQGLAGPFIQVTQERTILHPTHGAVTLTPREEFYGCGYQREFDREQQKARRAAD